MGQGTRLSSNDYKENLLNNLFVIVGPSASAGISVRSHAAMMTLCF